MSTLLIKSLGDLDELWTFNFYRNVANGLVPYRDFNMLQMPLLPLMYGLILKIITNELLVIRIISALISALIFTSVFKLLKELEVNKVFSFLISIIFALFLAASKSDFARS